MSASLLSLLQSGASSSPNISKYVAAALSFYPQSCEAPLSNLCSALRECREVSGLKQLVDALATHVHEIVRRKACPSCGVPFTIIVAALSRDLQVCG